MVRTIGPIRPVPHPVYDLAERARPQQAGNIDFTRSIERRIVRDVLRWARLQLKFPECFV